MEDKRLFDNLKALYLECFSDSKEVTDYLFSTTLGTQSSRYSNINGEIASALYIIDKNLRYAGNNIKLPFFTGICTRKKYRNMYMAKNLIKETLKELDEPFAMLYPAVQNFYEKMGFATVSYDEITDTEFVSKATDDMNLIADIYKEYTSGKNFYLELSERDFDRRNIITKLDNGVYRLLYDNEKLAGFTNGEEEILLKGVSGKVKGAMARLVNLKKAFALLKNDIPLKIKLNDNMIEKNNLCFTVKAGEIKICDSFDTEMDIAELCMYFFGGEGSLKKYFPAICGRILERY